MPAPNLPKDQPQNNPPKSPFAGAADGYTLGLQFMVSILVGAAMGYGLDFVLGTLPLFLLVFICLGFAAGLRSIWRALEQKPVEPVRPAQPAEPPQK